MSGQPKRPALPCRTKGGEVMLEKQVTIRIDKELLRKIEQLAKKHKRKFSDMARLILEENMEKYE